MWGDYERGNVKGREETEKHICKYFLKINISYATSNKRKWGKNRLIQNPSVLEGNFEMANIIRIFIILIHSTDKE